jgi:hypothetical protein
VLSTPPRGPKVFVVFVIDPGKSNPTATMNSARGFLAENDVKKLSKLKDVVQTHGEKDWVAISALVQSALFFSPDCATIRVHVFLPSTTTLLLRSTRNKYGNFLPILATVRLYRILQLEVFGC